MQLARPEAEIFVPDGLPPDEAMARVTRLGIGAHPDDLEFMAFHGIVACQDRDAEWFGGVVCSDGARSARAGKYAAVSDAEMRGIRREEQNRAALLGRYGAMVHLDYPSATIKAQGGGTLPGDLATILRHTRPLIVYTHNLADKHDTHVAVAVAALGAMRSLPLAERPRTVYGCEVWRDLDWMLDHEKIVQDLGRDASLADALNAAFDSQIAGGKRYDLGITGRRRANATFFNPHVADGAESVAIAMDLSVLVADDAIDMADYVDGFIARFREDVKARINRCLGR